MTVVAGTGVIPLGDVRARAAAALQPIIDTDPMVLMDVVDAVTPPVLMLLWDDPWLEPQGISRCIWWARLVVQCIAGRLEPGPGVTKLEELLVYTVDRLQADTYTWPLASSQAPRVFTIANVPLLGARMVFRVPVTT